MSEILCVALSIKKATMNYDTMICSIGWNVMLFNNVTRILHDEVRNIDSQRAHATYRECVFGYRAKP